jgi:FkbM family methyltransferase
MVIEGTHRSAPFIRCDSGRWRRIVAGTDGWSRLAALVAPPVSVPEQTAFLQPRWLRDAVDRARTRMTPAITRRRDRFLFRALASASTLYLDMLANVCFEMDVNGELRVLQQLATQRPSCVFDVGANVGDWSIAAARLLPHARIEAFEIVPDTARLMEAQLATAGVDSVHLNPIGLSDENGTTRVAHLPGFSQGSSAAVVQPAGEVQWRECTVRAGDDFCREQGIDHIDLLKIDVEGLESKVLNGFAGMLETASINAVQFEYGHLNASVRFLLGDFYDLFEGYGYVVGKIFPDQVDFHGYDAWRDENFRGPNYLAVHADRTDLIERLAARA